MSRTNGWNCFIGTSFCKGILNLHWSLRLFGILRHLFPRWWHIFSSANALFCASDCLYVTCSFTFEKLKGLPLFHYPLPTYVVSKARPASSLPNVVLTKQHKEVVHCYVYFPSLRCGFLTTTLGLFWESSTSKTWSNLLHPEAIEQNKSYGCCNLIASKNM